MIPLPAGREAGAADWNVVVTLAEQGFRDAVALLRKWGRVHRTPYYNVLAMTVESPDALLVAFAAALEASPGIRNFVSHLVPAQQAFAFDAAEDFERQARAVALAWAPKLEGRSFHVRLHRRGLKGMLSTPREEQLLADALLCAAPAARIAFTDADAVLQIETIDKRAGMSLWSGEDLRRYPFLGAN